jgi:hypothetical protein
MLIGQIQTDALQVAGWLASLFFIAGGVNQVLKLLDRAREKPPPLETYVTKLDCQRQQGNEGARIERLEQSHYQLHAEFKTDLARVHQRLDDLATDFNDKIQSLPSQIIATLRNTGAIK